MIINSEEDTALSVLVSSALDILELPEDLKTIINEVVSVYEEYEKITLLTHFICEFGIKKVLLLGNLLKTNIKNPYKQDYDRR